jgi:peptide deformylase
MTIKDNSRRMFLKTALMGGATLFSLSCSKKSNKTILDVLTKKELALISTKKETMHIVKWRLKKKNSSSVLRLKAKIAGNLDHRKLVKLDNLMRKTLKKSGGVGLAAPQVGISRRFVLVKLQGNEGKLITCIDPKIIAKSKESVDGYEGCLSIPGLGGKVSRSKWVELTYYNLDGKLITYKSSGWEARIFQHELDHLEGTLYIDKIVGDLLPYDEIKKIKEKKKKEELSSKTAYLIRETDYLLM